MQELSAFLDALSKLLGTLVWPCLFLYIMIRFRSPITSLIENIGEFNFKGMGLEASLQRRKVEATAALVAAAVGRPETASNPNERAREVQAVKSAVSAVTPRTARLASRSKVLWVDDHPDNNVWEREALQAFGIDFTLAISTEEALERLQVQKFDAVISDMGRPPDSRAGYTLLDAMRSRKDHTPFVIYAGSNDPKHVVESQRHGALGCTNRTDELFDYVLRAIGAKASAFQDQL